MTSALALSQPFLDARWSKVIKARSMATA